MLMSIISIIYNGIPINNVVQYLVMKIGKRNQRGKRRNESRSSLAMHDFSQGTYPRRITLFVRIERPSIPILKSGHLGYDFRERENEGEITKCDPWSYKYMRKIFNYCTKSDEITILFVVFVSCIGS